MGMVVPTDVDGLLNRRNAPEVTIGYVVTGGSGCGATGIDLGVDQMRRREVFFCAVNTRCVDVDGCRPTHRPNGGPAPPRVSAPSSCRHLESPPGLWEWIVH